MDLVAGYLCLTAALAAYLNEQPLACVMASALAGICFTAGVWP